MTATAKEQCVCTTLEKTPRVDIDDDGTFNYMLVKVQCENTDHVHFFVAGHKRYQSLTDFLKEVSII